MKRVVFLLFLLASVARAQTPTPSPPPAALMNWPTARTVLDLTYPNTTNQVVGWDNTNKKFVFVTNASGGISPPVVWTLAPGVETVNVALTLSNTTVSTSGNDQWSPSLHFEGKGFQTGGGGDKLMQWRIYQAGFTDNPIQNYLYFDSQTGGAGGNAGTWVNRALIWDGSAGGGPFGSWLFIDNVKITGTAGKGVVELSRQTSTPNTPTANNVFLYSDTSGNLSAKDSGGTVHNLFAGGGSGGYIGTVIKTVSGGVTTTGNYTPSSASVTHVTFRIIGAGGGGGGITSVASTNGASAGGGGSGGFLVKFNVAVSFGTNYAYQIGAGGAGGTTAPTNGSDGSAATTLTIGATTYTCNQGLGGTSMAAGTTLSAVAGGNGGTASNGDINQTGGKGGSGRRTAGTNALSGVGGSNPFGVGGQAVDAVSANGPGLDGNGPGAGGSGGASVQASGANQVGGAGKDGIIIIDEFS